MFGAQNVPPALPAFIIARASLPIASPTMPNSSASNDAAVPICSGKDVALGVGGRKVTEAEVAIPWLASPHHS